MNRLVITLSLALCVFTAMANCYRYGKGGVTA